MMNVQWYILKKLANILVSSGASPSWIEDRIKKKLGKDSIPNDVKPDAVFEGVSVGKLAVAGDSLANIPDADKKEPVPPEVEKAELIHILAEIGYLENKHEWGYPKHSSAGRMQWVAYFLIALAFSLYEIVNYTTVTSIAQHHQYWGYALLFLLLLTLSSVILWVVENIKLGKFLSCLISSFLLAFMAKICKCVIPVRSETFAFSLLWGSMVILVVGIMFVRGVLDFALHHYEQAKNELFSAIRDSAALSLGLFMFSLIFGIDFVHGGPEKLAKTDSITYLVECLLVGLGSVGFFLCFSADLVNGDHKKLLWLSGWIFILGLLADGICALVRTCWDPKCDDILRDLLSVLLVSVIIYLASRLILYCKDDTWPTEILFVPSIVMVVPGCGLCKKVSDLLLIALAILTPTIAIRIGQNIHKKCKSCSIATHVKSIEWKDFFSAKAWKKRIANYLDKLRKWWKPWRGDIFANDYKVWQYLTIAVAYISEAGENENVLAGAAKSIVEDKVLKAGIDQTQYLQLHQFIGSVILFLYGIKNDKSYDMPKLKEIEEDYSDLLRDHKYDFAEDKLRNIVPVLQKAEDAKVTMEDRNTVIFELADFLKIAVSKIMFPNAQ